MTRPAEPDRPLTTLYESGERFGWTFRDRNMFRNRYPHPYPSPVLIADALATAAETARTKMVRRMVGVGAAAFGAASLLACCAAGATYVTRSSPAAVLFIPATLTVAAGLAGIVIVRTQAGAARSALIRARRQQADDHQKAVAAWELSRAEHDRAEQQRVDALDEWGAVSPPPGGRRVDIVGGNLWGWEALLTVFGGSLLRTRGTLFLADFTGEQVCRELVRLADSNDVPYDVRMLPSGLRGLNLLAGLSSRQIVDALIESIHGGAAGGGRAAGDRSAGGAAGGGNRAERAQDDRILMALCGVLEGEARSVGDSDSDGGGVAAAVTLPRIAAALRVLMGDRGTEDALTPDERRLIGSELFTADFRREAYPSLRRIEAFIHPLAEMGTTAPAARAALAAPASPAALAAPAASTATLTCLVDESEGHSARREMLRDLVVQTLIQRVGGNDPIASSIVIAGADGIDHMHLERLTDLCERRGIRLVLLFRHLRGAAVTALGGGVAGFMRLPNHEEAREAADFIGREHKFVLTELTRSVGGEETHSNALTDGFESRKSSGWSPVGQHASRESARSWGRTRTIADGANWASGESRQRVYEYAVEPRTLQELPDYALLLVNGQGADATLQPVECNPEIVLLPRVTMGPLPAVTPGTTKMAGAGVPHQHDLHHDSVAAARRGDRADLPQHVKPFDS